MVLHLIPDYLIFLRINIQCTVKKNVLRASAERIISQLPEASKSGLTVSINDEITGYDKIVMTAPASHTTKSIPAAKI